MRAQCVGLLLHIHLDRRHRGKGNCNTAYTRCTYPNAIVNCTHPSWRGQETVSLECWEGCSGGGGWRRARRHAENRAARHCQHVLGHTRAVSLTYPLCSSAQTPAVPYQWQQYTLHDFLTTRE